MPKRLLLLAAVLMLGAAPPPDARDPFPGMVARSIGPATMGGRVTAVAVVEASPATQYVGAAAGGLWKTTDDGRTWACVFEGRPHASVGAVAVAPSDPSVVWLGTGEANARNSVSWGDGVFLSRDAGKTWAHVGLAETHHVGRIVVHPDDPDTAYVAALGHLWGPNPERGVFVTRDGGKTWGHTLKLDADTGAVDLAADPRDPKTLYAAAYAVRRDAFSGGNPVKQFGERAGIYRTRDGGASWQRLAKGLPKSPMGRIGLSVYRKDPRVVFAVVPTEKTDVSKVHGQAPRQGGAVETGGVFVSRDRGDTWRKLNDLCPRPFYFSQIRVDPADEARVWVLGIPLYASVDGGKTFRPSPGAARVHVDHHDLWIGPADPRHLLLGTDGGLYSSRNRGQTWTPIMNLPISQFYGVGLDTNDPYRIYGGLQDNGSWGGPSRNANPLGIINSDWSRILGFDGYHCRVPPDAPNTVYAEGQYGRLHRYDRRTGNAVSIRPGANRPDAPKVRFNWSSPIELSPFDSKTIYYGGNVVFESKDRGQTWREISPDLTRGKPGVAYRALGHTLTALAVSPAEEGVLYAGSDDGKVHVTRDGGVSWADVSDKLPGVAGPYTVTRISASATRGGTAYLALTRHRQDDRAPYLFRTDDHGKTWRSIAGGLPSGGPIHGLCVTKDPRLLFLGTEFGAYVSLDAGGSWERLRSVPRCPVHDLVIHPRERELVVATHGRGIYVMDVAPLEELTPKVLAAKAHLFRIRPVKPRAVVPMTKPVGRTYAGQNPPDGAVIHYRIGAGARRVNVEIVSAEGNVISRVEGATTPGLHRVVWNLKRPTEDGELVAVPAGEYVVRLKVGDFVQEQKVEVGGAGK